MRRILLSALVPAILGALAAGIALPAHAVELTVSAASSLAQALRDVAPRFEAAHPGIRLRLNFAASGALLQQIDKGAPVDVFVSADLETMNQAQARALVLAGQRRNIVSNALVLVVPASVAKLPKTLDALLQPAVQRVAIGLPASVPAGRYARSALEAAGLWTEIKPKLIFTNNVRQALDYVARAEVDAGFVYATDAALQEGKVKLAFTVQTAKPILYPAAIVSSSSHAAAAQQLMTFLVSAPAQAVFAGHGFGKP